MMLANLTIPGSGWSWAALAAAVALVPLAWLALAPAGARSRTLAVGLALRTLGVGLLLICLLDPKWTAPRTVRGANLFAVLADNSQGMTITDPGASETRGEHLRTQLTDPDAGWHAALAEEFQVRSYSFGRDLTRVRGFSALDFSGDRSDLGAALQRLQERHVNQPLAGVLLFTDGNATDLDETLAGFPDLPPVYPVVVGESGVRDVRLDRVTVRQTAFDDAPVSVQAEVAGNAIGSGDVQVSIAAVGSAAGLAASELPQPARLRLRDDGARSSTTFTWRPSGTGVQFYEVGAEAPPGIDEATLENNRRLLMINRGRPEYRILYVGGRPGWEFKFLNRALSDDQQLRMVALMRVARREPKFEFKGRAGESSNPMFRGFAGDPEDAPRYDQPVLVRVNTRDENELRGGFPVTAEELFAYDAVILDDIEAAFFTLEQKSLLRQFAADRGGGLLVLGGADSLENGGFAGTPVAAALPIYLDRTSEEMPQGALRWSLTREGWVEPWARVRENESDERVRMQALPTLFVTHGLDRIKPGATVLAQVEDERGRVFPSLVAQSFGAGRVICLTAGDLWRWGLAGTTDGGDLARFWRQVARRLVTDVPSQVTVRVEDESGGGVRLRVTARDKAYRLLDLANVRVTVRRLSTGAAAEADAEGTRFQSVTIPAEPVADRPGHFAAAFAGRDAGAYVATAEVTAPTGEVIGSSTTGWVVDTAAEEFRSVNPNGALLAAIAKRTGGEVVSMNRLAEFVASLPSRAAPVQELSSRPIWHTGWVFLAVLMCFVAEWFWRRWNGLP